VEMTIYYEWQKGVIRPRWPETRARGAGRFNAAGLRWGMQIAAPNHGELACCSSPCL